MSYYKRFLFHNPAPIQQRFDHEPGNLKVTKWGLQMATLNAQVHSYPLRPRPDLPRNCLSLLTDRTAIVELITVWVSLGPLGNLGNSPCQGKLYLILQTVRNPIIVVTGPGRRSCFHKSSSLTPRFWRYCNVGFWDIPRGVRIMLLSRACREPYIHWCVRLS